MHKVLLFIALCVPALPALAQKTNADLDCKPTGKDFVYDCTILLSQAGKPLAGAKIIVGADMPSMPMAHNVRPSKAVPGGTPGEYRATLDLEMLGEWAVKLRLAGPVKDQLILHYTFDEKGAQATKSNKARSTHKH